MTSSFQLLARITSLALFVVMPREVVGQGPSWQMEVIDLAVTVDTGRAILIGEGSLRFTARGAPQDSLTLQIGSTGRFESLAASGAIVQPTADDRSRTLRWRVPVPSDSSVDVQVRFSHPRNGFQVIVTPKVALASWAAGWYPSPAGLSSRARGCITFRVPGAWSVIATGAPDRSVAKEMRWCSDTRLDWSFVAGPHEVHERAIGSSRLRLHALPGRAKALEGYLDAMAATVAALAQTFGPLPGGNYGLVEIPDGVVTWGGSSEQGFFMAPAQALGTRVNFPLVAHELAHSWWGNAVQQTGAGSLMISEALAQVGAALAIEAIEGPAAFRDFMRFSRDGYNSRQSARGYFTMAALGHDRALSQLTGEGQDHNLSDAKGHWVWMMVRDEMGPEQFGAVLREVQQRFAGRRASLADVRELMIRAASDTSRMRKILSQWLDQSGAPNIGLTWRSVSQDTIEVRLTQGAPNYVLRVPVRVDTDHGVVNTAIEISGATAIHRLQVPGSVRGVTLDPDYRLLRWDPDYGVPPSSSPTADRSRE